MTPVKYLQTDARWGSNDYSAAGEKTTIAKSGCGPTCMAMIIATLADATVTPADTCAWAKAHGYKAKNQGTYYSYFPAHAKLYGIEIKQITTSSIYGSSSSAAKAAHAEIEKALKAGNWVLACMGKGIWTSSGHFVLAYKISGSNVMIRDPNSEKAMRECNNLKTWESQVKHYWVITVKEKGVEDTMTEAELNARIDERIKAALKGADTTVSTSLKEEFEAAKAAGITDGTRPGGYVTREQSAVMAYRASKSK